MLSFFQKKKNCQDSQHVGYECGRFNSSPWKTPVFKLLKYTKSLAEYSTLSQAMVWSSYRNKILMAIMILLRANRVVFLFSSLTTQGMMFARGVVQIEKEFQEKPWLRRSRNFTSFFKKMTINWQLNLNFIEMTYSEIKNEGKGCSRRGAWKSKWVCIGEIMIWDIILIRFKELSIWFFRKLCLKQTIYMIQIKFSSQNWDLTGKITFHAIIWVLDVIMKVLFCLTIL